MFFGFMNLFLKIVYLFLYFWLHRVLVVAYGIFSLRGFVSGCGVRAPVAATCGLSYPAARGNLSSLAGNRTCVLCVARQILKHWTLWKFPHEPF